MRSNIIDKLLGDITPERQAEIDMKIKVFLEYHDQLKRDGKKFNTDTSISLEHLRDNGFNPIAITQMFLEETFVFQTEEEAEHAFRKMEQEDNIVTGWWYGKEKFIKSFSDYCIETESEPKIYYLDGWE